MALTLALIFRPKIQKARYAKSKFNRTETSTADVSKIPVILGSAWSGGYLSFLGKVVDDYSRETGSRWHFPCQFVLARDVETIQSVFITGDQAWTAFNTYRNDSDELFVSGISLDYHPRAVNSVPLSYSSVPYATATADQVFITRPSYVITGLPRKTGYHMFLHAYRIQAPPTANVPFPQPASLYLAQTYWKYGGGDIIKNLTTGETVEILRIIRRSELPINLAISQAPRSAPFYEIRLKAPFKGAKPTGKNWEIRASINVAGVPAIVHNVPTEIELIASPDANFEDTGTLRGTFTFLDGRAEQNVPVQAPTFSGHVARWEDDDLGVQSFRGVSTIHCNDFWTGSFSSVPQIAFLCTNRTLPYAEQILGTSAKHGQWGVNPIHAIVELLSNPVYGEGLSAKEFDIPLAIETANSLRARYTEGACIYENEESIRNVILNILSTFGLYRIRDPQSGKQMFIPAGEIGLRTIYGNENNGRTVENLNVPNANDRIFYLKKPANDSDYFSDVPAGSRIISYAVDRGQSYRQEFIVTGITSPSDTEYQVRVDRLIRNDISWDAWQMRVSATYPVLNAGNIAKVVSVSELVLSKTITSFSAEGTDLSAPNRKQAKTATIQGQSNLLPQNNADDSFPYITNSADLNTVANRELAERHEEQLILVLEIPTQLVEKMLPGDVYTIQLPTHGVESASARITEITLTAITTPGATNNSASTVTLKTELQLGEFRISVPTARPILPSCN